MANESDDTEQKQDVMDAPSLISWRHLGAASVLGLLSLVDEWQVTTDLKITGGPTLVALAAIVLMWPVLRQIAARGGEIDLKGLRLRVNKIENEAQRIEIDNAMRIEELESEMDGLRTQPTSAVHAEGQIKEVETGASDEDVSMLEWASAAYGKAVPLGDFRKRVEIDKEIIRRGGHLSLSTLRDFLIAQAWSAEAQMAVAVALGLPPRNEESDRARLLAELVHSSHERVRARSGQAAKRWGERRTTSKVCRNVLLNTIDERLAEESATSGARSFLEKARDILSATRDWDET